MLPPFDTHHTSLERSIQGQHPQKINVEPEMESNFFDHSMLKKRRLGPQNGSGSLGPKNCQK